MFGLQQHSRKAEHNFCRGNLSAFVDGQLSIRERERVSRHLEQCESCRDDLQSLQRTVELLRALPRVRAPRSFQIPVNTPAPTLPFWMRPWAYNAVRVATAAAAAFLAVALAGNTLMFSGGAPVAPESPLAAAQSGRQEAAAPEASMSKAEGTSQADGVTVEAVPAGAEAYGESSPPTVGAFELAGEPALTAEEAARATAAPRGMGNGPAETAPAGRDVTEPEAAATPEPITAMARGEELPAAPAPGNAGGVLPEASVDVDARIGGNLGLARYQLGRYPWGWLSLVGAVVFATLLATGLWLRSKRARWPL